MLAASAISTSQIYLMLFVGLAGFYMMWTTQRKLRARANSPLDRPDLHRARVTSDFQRDSDQVMVELNEFARSVNAQLDTRAARLETLIRQADERLDRLKQAQALLPAASAESQTADAGLSFPPSSSQVNRLKAGNGSSLQQRVARLATQGHNAQQIASQLKITSSEVELILALHQADMSAGRKFDREQTQAAVAAGSTAG